MKAIIKTITLGAFLIGSTATINVQATSIEALEMHDHQLDTKTVQKVNSTVTGMAKDLGLNQKQANKIQDIKLHEAEEIESVRMDENKSQNEVNNKIIFIKNSTHSKVEKVLDKNQQAKYQENKSNYEYNPGLIENIKDKFNEKKENIQERREEKNEK
ncbi:MAG TPA: hypothetical protein VLZ75_05855 [Chitinophagales bacterium]|nr:hypothetical protein [Chitinophagales bacterium]